MEIEIGYVYDKAAAANGESNSGARNGRCRKRHFEPLLVGVGAAAENVGPSAGDGIYINFHRRNIGAGAGFKVDFITR